MTLAEAENMSLTDALAYAGYGHRPPDGGAENYGYRHHIFRRDTAEIVGFMAHDQAWEWLKSRIA